jgi:hypothetical protein
MWIARFDVARRHDSGVPVIGALVAVVLLAVVLLAGCGNSRTVVPSVSQPLAPKGARTLGGKLGSSDQEYALLAPANWDYDPVAPQPPVVMIYASGAAVIALSRYPSTVAPIGQTALHADATALLGAIKAKDPHFTLISSTITTVSSRPAVELSGTERITGQLRRVISTHVYLAQGELVLDEYAPVKEFARLKRVFVRARSSLTVFPVRTK